MPRLKTGTKLICTRSGCEGLFVAGNLYDVLGYDDEGDYLLKTESGYIPKVGFPLKGCIFEFKVDKNEGTKLLSSEENY